LLCERVDLNVSGVITGQLNWAAAGDELLRHVLAVALGEAAAAERLGYGATMDIQMAGPAGVAVTSAAPS
jgi:altronate dehydratase